MRSTVRRTTTDQTGVTASGWGAGQTGTALGILDANEQSTTTLDSIGLVILDNNTNRAGGGFWTTYCAVRAAAVHLGGPHAERS